MNPVDVRIEGDVPVAVLVGFVVQLLLEGVVLMDEIARNAVDLLQKERLRNRDQPEEIRQRAVQLRQRLRHVGLASFAGQRVCEDLLVHRRQSVTHTLQERVEQVRH